MLYDATTIEIITETPAKEVKPATKYTLTTQLNIGQPLILNTPKEKHIQIKNQNKE